MQTPPTSHSGVAAIAAPGATAQMPPAVASAATAASTFLLIDSTSVDDGVMTDLLSADLRLWVRDAPKAARQVPAVAPGMSLVSTRVCWRAMPLMTRRRRSGRRRGGCEVEASRGPRQ